MSRWLLRTYSLLLHFYPPAFRKRFAAEMMELAGAADLSDWPFVFCDTGLAIVRCWVEGSPSSGTLTQANVPMSLGGSSLRSLGLGFVLSTVVLAGLAYVGYRWPPPCSTTKPLVTRIVQAPHTVVNSANAAHPGLAPAPFRR